MIGPSEKKVFIKNVYLVLAIIDFKLYNLPTTQPDYPTFDFQKIIINQSLRGWTPKSPRDFCDSTVTFCHNGPSPANGWIWGRLWNRGWGVSRDISANVALMDWDTGDGRWTKPVKLQLAKAPRSPRRRRAVWQRLVHLSSMKLFLWPAGS